MVQAALIDPMIHHQYPRVLAGKDGGTLFYQRPGFPVFFVSGPVERRSFSSLAPRAMQRTALINGAMAIPVFDAMLHAGAAFQEVRSDRPPAANPADILIEFLVPNGLRVFYCDRDRTVILDSRWLENRGFGLVVGPTVYRGGLPGSPNSLPEINTAQDGAVPNKARPPLPNLP